MRLLWKKYKKNCFDINVDECGIHQYALTDKYCYTVTQEYVLHYVEEGIGYIETEGKKYIVQKDEFFLLKKGMSITYYADFINPWRYCWIGFSGSLPIKYLKKSFNKKECVFKVSEKSNLAQLLMDFTHSIHENESLDTELYRLKHIHKIFFDLCKEFEIEDDSSSIEIINKIFETALAYVNKNFCDSINIADVCDHLNITRSYLYKLFMQYMGISPQTYLIQIRLYHASRLLITTNTSIKEIAYASGYIDQLQFSSQFKKNYLVSPKEYRNKYSKHNNS
ncbi:AraC family transcriptional regulator [Tannockella kyphosi]|uniref:AraC family transcriptional regulator n=1 Tax=Tannockella kyphosi TaxID=2899121 RepID=UPI0020110273|nr:AraC family transcriptional regulator [Tannockella kyphosi]